MMKFQFSKDKCKMLWIVLSVWFGWTLIFGYYTYNTMVYNEKPRIIKIGTVNCTTGINNINIKQWKYIFFQHIRKNGGSMICKLFYKLGLVTETSFKHNCRISDKLQREELIFQSFKNKKKMSISEYSLKVEQLKTYVKNDLKCQMIASEVYDFPLIAKINTNNNSKIFDQIWNDTLLITNFRSPFAHVLSEITRGMVARIKVNSQTLDCRDIFSDMIDNYNYSDSSDHDKNIDLSNKKIDDLIINCIQNNIAISYNSYIQIFSNKIQWSAWKSNLKLSSIKKKINFQTFANAKYVISKFDIILITELYNVTMIQFLPFGIIPQCSKLWFKAYQFGICNNDAIYKDNNTTLNFELNLKINMFRNCYNHFFKNNIKVVQPHTEFIYKLNYNTASINVKNLVANYTKWDAKLYNFAKQLAIERSTKIFNGQMW